MATCPLCFATMPASALEAHVQRVHPEGPARGGSRAAEAAPPPSKKHRTDAPKPAPPPRAPPSLSRAELGALSVSALKAALSARGVDCKGMLEKQELVDKLLELQAQPQPPPRRSAPPSASASPEWVAAAFADGSGYAPPPWALERRPADPKSHLYFKLLVIAEASAIRRAVKPSASPTPRKQPPPTHITVTYWTERGVGRPITGAMVDAVKNVCQRFKGHTIGLVERPGYSGCCATAIGGTSVDGALARLRQALVSAANVAAPRGGPYYSPLQFRSTDGGPEAIDNWHVTKGLRPSSRLDPSRFPPAEAAWLRSQPRPVLGWELKLEFKVSAHLAPIRANDALHQALLWCPDSNRTATPVGNADFVITGAEKIEKIGKTLIVNVKDALRELQKGRRPGQCPQYG